MSSTFSLTSEGALRAIDEDNAVVLAELEAGAKPKEAAARRRSSIDEIKTILDQSNHSSEEVKKFARGLSIISRKYDLDGDGVLNEAERALRDMDSGDGLNKMAVYNHIQELMATQKQLMNTKRILCLVTSFLILLLLSIFGLSFAVAKLTDDTDVIRVEAEVGTADMVVVGDTDVVVSTVAEGHVVHMAEQDVVKEDPYGLAASTGSLFFPPGQYGTSTDMYQCEIADYLSSATFLGIAPHCKGIYHSAEKGQAISFVSSDDTELAPGQSIVTVTLHPEETWSDPIIPSESFSFYKETVHMVKGNLGGDQCRLLVFIEEAGHTSCPYYEIPSCEIPACVASPPQYVSTNVNEQTSYPEP